MTLTITHPATGFSTNLPARGWASYLARLDQATTAARPFDLPAAEHIIIGKVSTLKNARWHLSILGRAHCGAGTGRTAAATRWRVDGSVTREQVCRRCLKTLRRRLAENAASGDVYAQAADTMLAPDDPRRDAEMLADIRIQLTRSGALEPGPLELAGLDPHTYRRRLLAELTAA